jgi:sulfur carrier protein
MPLLINDLLSDLPTPATPQAVFSFLKIENTNGFALAVNNKVIPRTKWEEMLLEENDKVIIIQATQGG